MPHRLLLLSMVMLVGLVGHAAAQECGRSYRIAPGDSLSKIAEAQYRNAFRWTDIYDENRDAIGPDPDRILVGAVLRLPCLSGILAEAAQPDPAEDAGDLLRDQDTLEKPAVEERGVILNAAAALPPFSDETLERGGLFPELIQALLLPSALEPSPVRFVPLNNFSASTVQGEGTRLWFFPVMRAGCEGAATTGVGCPDLVFSAPVIEVLIHVYTRSVARVLSTRSEDIRGRRFCRPDGMPVDLLEDKGRQWLSDGLIDLRWAETAEQCFEWLRDGQVDAVVINEFTGRYLLEALALDGVVDELQAPLGTAFFHAATLSRTPGAAQAVADFNDALVRFRQHAEYKALMARYLTRGRAGL